MKKTTNWLPLNYKQNKKIREGIGLVENHGVMRLVQFT